MIALSLEVANSKMIAKMLISFQNFWIQSNIRYSIQTT